MSNATYETKREELQTYFDRTAKDKWVALTSNTPVSRIRETVRKGREEMRNTLLEWLPGDLSGARILDAGCGTGMLAIEAARRGADVLAIDISPALIEEAQKRMPTDLSKGKIEFLAGDMMDPGHGEFDYIVAMDSFIHYPLPEIMNFLEALGPRAKENMSFTFAPSTPALEVMKAVGKIFPKNDRSPAIEPVKERKMVEAIAESEKLRGDGYNSFRMRKISTGFYKSQALELKRS